MFQVEEFKEFTEIKPLIEELSDVWESSEFAKVSRTLQKLLVHKNDTRFRKPISYIFSMIAEHKSSLIPEEAVEKSKDWLNSKNETLRLNSAAILGYYLVRERKNIEIFEPLLSTFITLLKDNSPDIRSNILLFLEQLADTININQHSDFLLRVLNSEKSHANIISLLKFLTSCNELNFEQLQELRQTIIHIVKNSFVDSQTFRKSIRSILTTFYPNLTHLDFLTTTPQKLITALQNHIIITRRAFQASETSFEQEIEEDFTPIIEKYKLPEDRSDYLISISYKTEDRLYIYEIEKKALITFFNRNRYLKSSEINSQFSAYIEDKEDLDALISYFSKSGYIKGYYSQLGIFYPERYLRTLIVSELETKGKIHRNSLTYLPLQMIENILKSFGEEFTEVLLEAKTFGTYYSSPHIFTDINKLARKHSSINFIKYEKILTPSSYYKLVNNLSPAYFSQYHDGTSFLTNYGLNQILNEITHSQSIGFFTISKLSSRFNISIPLVRKVVDEIVDRRSGIYDISKDTFYYTQFIRNKIKSITKEESQTQATIQSIANELKIKQFHIAQTLKAHRHSIEKEINRQDKISIKRYMGKTGLDFNEFMDFIDTLGRDYLRHGIWLIFDKEKIEKAKEDIKATLLDQAKRVTQIILTSQNFRITYQLIYDLAQELYNEGKIEGILYEGEKRTVFYTPKGISNLIKRNQVYFSYSDLFPGNELSEKDTTLITSLIENLLKDKKIEGKFEESEHKFSSYDTVYARNVQDLIRRFSNVISQYFKEFEKTHQKVKKLLIKEEEVIRPHAIKTIETIINHIQSNFTFWKSEIDKELYKANKILNKIYPKPEKKQEEKKKQEIKGKIDSKEKGKEEEKKSKEKPKKFQLQKEPEVNDLLTAYDGWTQLFNTLEQKFSSVIYHQQILRKNPNNIESRRALYKLLEELKMN